MGSVRMWLRAEFAARWKALAGVALLIGISGGVVLAAVAGARRTETAYDRMLVAQDAADVVIADDGEIGIDIPLADIIALPQVASHARASLILYVHGQYAAVASVDDRLGRTMNRFKIVAGRMYDSSRVDEVVVGLGVARALKLKVGSEFPLVDPEFTEDLEASGLSNTTLRVVGIVTGSGEFPPQYIGLSPSIHMTPALFRTYGNQLASGDASPERGTLYLKLKNGAADVPAFRRALEALAPGEPVLPSTAQEIGLHTERSFGFQATGLWFLAAFAAVAALLVGAQALSRQAFLGSIEFPTLGALGLGRGGLMLVGLARAGIVGVTASAIAVGVAIALSPLAPAGDARYAEPHPGINVDGMAIGLGAAALILGTILLALEPTRRAARRGLSPDEAAVALRPSRIAAFFARASMPVSGVAGARLAFESGRGSAAVPLRSTVLGAAFGLAVLIAAATFGSSLDKLIATPSLYGVGWDAFLTHYGDGPDMRERKGGLLAADGIEDLTIGTDLPLVIEGRQVFALGIERLRGAAGPPIVAGRPPRTPNEIALTSKTARRIGARFGDRIRARVPIGGTEEVEFTLVGHTVIPPFGFVNGEPGEGALMSIDGALRLVPADADIGGLVSDALVRFT
ncbi:MAG: ABC transporter permease, partial [Actinomycetota bacterium]